MLRIFHNTTYDFIKWWRHAAGLTIAFIAIGLASFAFRGGVNYSIEFTSGTLMQVKFNKPVDDALIRSTLTNGGVHGAEIQAYGTARDEYTIRARDTADVKTLASGAEGVAKRARAALEKQFGAGTFEVVRTEAVGPRVGAELKRGAAIAMLLASMVTLVYLAVRFEWRFGLAAVLSTGHDVLVTLTYIKIMHIEVSLTVVAAILTLLGYSGNDTIIIFDRVRENLKKDRKSSFYDLLNRSINETLPRSVMTHVTTLTATLALLFFAGEVIRPFAEVMAFGIFMATFSSIYVASPLLLWIERRFPRHADEKDKTRVAQRAAVQSDASPTPPPEPRPRARKPRDAATR